MADLVFLRPGWLALLPLVPALAGWMWHRAGRSSGWRAYGEPELVREVLEPVRGAGWSARAGWVLLLLVPTLAVLALAGPSWERRLTEAMRPAHTRVVVLDLSRSMDAEDVRPSRLGLALSKVRAIFERSRGLQLGLAVFAGASFHVAPLTTDAATLLHHLDVMETSLMPVQGSRPDMGLSAAGELLERGGALTGEVILVSDGYRGEKAAGEAARLRERGFPVSVLGVGTPDGATIPVGDGEVLRSLAGAVVRAPAYLDGLRAIAAAGGGRYASARPGDRDLDEILLSPERWREAVDDPDRRLSVPEDGGAWLLLLLLPLAALGFRRGWLLGVLLVLAPALQPADAAWTDWLKGADYRAAVALRDGDPERALGLARDPMIIGAAYYVLGHYGPAAAAFAQRSSARAHYNRGNALARSGRVPEAIDAYDMALALDPGLADARFNQAVLARLLDREPARARASGASDPDRPREDTPPPAPGGAERTDPGSSGPDEDRPPTSSSPAASAGGDRAPPSGPEREFASVGDEGPSEAHAERWLARIPEEPGTLLRQKFELEFQKRRWQRAQNTDSW